MTTNTARAPLLLGLDVGTQSLRAALIDAHGRTVSVGIAPIETTYPRPSWAEQQPLQWWSAAGDAVRLALAQDDIEPSQIAGIGLDCTACTVLACDSAGQPHRPALHGDGDYFTGGGEGGLRRPGDVGLSLLAERVEMLAEVSAAVSERDSEHGGAGVGSGAKCISCEHAQTTGVGGKGRR